MSNDTKPQTAREVAHEFVWGYFGGAIPWTDIVDQLAKTLESFAQAETAAMRKTVLEHMAAEGQCIEEHHWKGSCPAEGLRAELKEARFLAQAAGPVLKWTLRVDTGRHGPTQGTPVVVSVEPSFDPDDRPCAGCGHRESEHRTYEPGCMECGCEGFRKR